MTAPLHLPRQLRTRRRTSVLVDPARDRRLRRDGFVTFPLLGAEDVARVRAEFGRLHGWAGRGFHADLNVADPDYRRDVRDVLSKLLAGRVIARFTEHRPFLYNFLCKFPGPDSELYLHRDWMYVDEREGGHTFVAWIALEDVDGDNGRLQVLPRSHRFDDRLRGSGITAPWIGHENVIRPRLRTLSVRAGDCVVLDNRLVHCSLANDSDVPRLVAAVGMRPPRAPLVHFQRVDGSTAALHPVDEDFFCTSTPAELEQGTAPAAVEALVPAPQRHLSGRHLRLLIDHRAAPALDRMSGPILARVPEPVIARLRRLPTDVPGPRRPAAGTIRRLRRGTGRLRRARPGAVVRRSVGAVGAVVDRLHLFIAVGTGRLRHDVRGGLRPVARHRMPGAGPRRSRLAIVVIGLEPDDRPSSRSLRDIVEELRRRPGVDVSTWFLRPTPALGDWQPVRVVDVCRWLPVRALCRVGATGPAARLRALRRHGWRIWLSLRADVVVYDDGIGARFLPPPSRSRRVVRRNGRPPAGAVAEQALGPGDPIDLTLVGPGSNQNIDANADPGPDTVTNAGPATDTATDPNAHPDPDAVADRDIGGAFGGRRLDAPLVRDWHALLGGDADAARARSRRHLGLPDDAVVAVGAGRDGWLDGPELFFRTLWELERRRAVVAHGVWLAPNADRHELDRLGREAERCGLRERTRLLADGTVADLLCGDVGLLPYRAAGDPFDVLGLVRSGLPVVTFPVWGWDDPAVVTVPHLDLAAAADAVDRVLAWDRGAVRSEAEERIEDAASWVDRFLDTVDGRA